MNKKYEELLKTDKYYDRKDLKYKIGLTDKEIKEYKKLNFETFGVELKGLVTFNSENMYFIYNLIINKKQSDYINVLLEGIEKYGKVASNNKSLIEKSFLFSEIEGTMQIEGVQTTRKKIQEISEGSEPTNENEKIVSNMFSAWKFINSKPEFNKENLYKLYNLLSADVLKEEDNLKDGQFYRDDYVGIGDGIGGIRYDGCPHEDVEKSMNSLFIYVKEQLNLEYNKFNEQHIKFRYFLPHIVHYYILYIHPYFDYNGRCARAVSLWIMMLTNKEAISPLFLGDAINNTKTNYYKALENTRDNENDITYFLDYIMETSIRYHLIYNNIEHIKEILKIEAETLSENDEYHLQRIMLYSNDIYFGWKDFVEFTNKNISQQAVLKALNRLEKQNILSSKINSSKIKMFILNKEMIKYKTSILK